MRTLNIEMSQAAKQRLNLLAAPDTLLVPMDPALLGPFGIKFVNTDMFIMFDNKKVALVPKAMNPDGKSFDLSLLVGPSEVLDKALKTIFKRITTHLDTVNKFMNQEKRARKKINDAEEAELAKAYEQTAAAEKEILYGFVLPEPETDVCSVSVQDLADASGYLNFEHPVYVDDEYDRDDAFCEYTFNFTKLSPVAIRFVVKGDRAVPTRPAAIRYVYESDREKVDAFVSQYPRSQIICREIERIANQNRKTFDVDDFKAALSGLPATPFNVESWLMDPKENVFITSKLPDDSFMLKGSPRNLSLLRNGQELMAVRISRFDGRFTDLRSQCTVVSDICDPDDITDQDLRNLLGFWIQACADADPDLDVSAYQHVDMDALAREAETVEVGYTM